MKKMWSGKPVLLLVMALSLMGAGPSACTVNLLKASHAITNLAETLAYEPTEAERLAEQRAFERLIAKNQQATDEWLSRYRVPMPDTLIVPPPE